MIESYDVFSRCMICSSVDEDRACTRNEAAAMILTDRWRLCDGCKDSRREVVAVMPTAKQ